ncbi:WD repeat-containing protein 97 isoform X3 [Dendropsophus ebraccatus]|uniref:WD repeat-containing protein 97 isoform X3 n=1 Tax=Dendropsophus ebraccatus TaxID=150705 RepID=UPI00383165E7
MERYLQLLYHERARYKIPEVDDLDPENPLTSLRVQEAKESCGAPLGIDGGFFTDSALGLSINRLPRHLRSSLLAAPVLPNSTLLQTLRPVTTEENVRPVRRPGADLKQPEKRSEMAKEKLTEETREAQAVEEGEEQAVEEGEEQAVEEWEEQNVETNGLDEIPSFLQDILANVNARKESPPAQNTSPPPPPPPARSLKQPKSTRTQVTRLSRIPRPHPVQTKTFPEAAVSVQTPLPPLPLSPPAVDKPYTTSCVTYMEEEPPVRNLQRSPGIPSFVLQFQDQSWFSGILPDAEEQYPDFESRILVAFLQADPPVCTQLLHALQTLHQQGHLKYPQRLLQTLRAVITRRTDLRVAEGLEFVCLCLRFMNVLSQESLEPIVELLVMCVQLQAPHREKVISLLHEFGVHDPQGFIAQKCSSWDSWEEVDRIETLRTICKDWLHLWTDRLVDHLQTVTTQNNELRAHGGKDVTRRSQRGKRTRHKEPRERLLYDVTPIDVLNYYCEVQMRRELLGLRGREPVPRSTVLALPPIDRWELSYASSSF